MAASIKDSWTRITAWLQVNAPTEYELLQRPASPEDLDNAAKQLGVRLPDDFRQLYQLMDGTDPNGDEAAIFPSAEEWDDMAYGPFALTQIVNEWQMQKELVEFGEFADRRPESCDPGIANEWWNVGWIPFAWNGGGDYYCINMAPTEDGTTGQVITHSHETGDHKILAPSLLVYLSDLAAGLDAGRFEYTDCGIKKIEANE